MDCTFSSSESSQENSTQVSTHTRRAGSVRTGACSVSTPGETGLTLSKSSTLGYFRAPAAAGLGLLRTASRFKSSGGAKSVRAHPPRERERGNEREIERERGREGEKGERNGENRSHKPTHTHSYIYTFTYTCVCVCVWVWFFQNIFEPL